MSLQGILDDLKIKTRRKVDRYIFKNSKLSAQAASLNEVASSCRSRAKGLEQFVEKCNQNYDAATDSYKCNTSESRGALEAEIIRLEQSIASHPNAKLPVQSEDEWKSISREYSEQSAYLSPFFDNSGCGQQKMICTWTGAEPQRLRGPLNLEYFDQGSSFLICEGNRGGKRVVFAPEKRMRQLKENNSDAAVVSWADALLMYGKKVEESMQSGACDV